MFDIKLFSLLKLLSPIVDEVDESISGITVIFVFVGLTAFEVRLECNIKSAAIVTNIANNIETMTKSAINIGRFSLDSSVTIGSRNNTLTLSKNFQRKKNFVPVIAYH